MSDSIIRNITYMSRSAIILFIGFLMHATGYAQPKKATVSPDFNQVFGPLKWRSIGPFRGGRSVAACGVPGDITTYYMGTTGGGLWKTDDMGTTWRNVSDGYFKTGSVGAVAVAESDRNVVYVGMGEHAPRGVMTHHGDGVYKSVDAGKSWKRVGLELTQHISRVIIHPADPNTVYVAAQGPLYGKSDQRGIFKTTDGGVSWKKVLYVDDKTGPAEITSAEMAYDLLNENNGDAFLMFPTLNYVEENHDVIHEMLTHPAAINGLSDGGADGFFLSLLSH